MNTKHQLLLVEDDSALGYLLSEYLKMKGFGIEWVKDGKQALKKLEDRRYDLCILDVMMPEMDGIEACERIRDISELKNTIITFFTARGEDYSMVAGYDAGADDYITKPIKPKVLVSKVKGLLRRLKETEETAEDSVVTIGNLIINREEYKIEMNGIEMILPRKEFELLSLLCSKPGKVFKREEILDKVWGNEVVVGGRTIDVHIRKLREKIGEDMFKTVKGIGYKFIG